MMVIVSWATKILLALFVVSAIIFTIWPRLDIDIARLFWNAKGGFIYADLWINNVIYIFVPNFLRIVGVGLLIYLLASCFKWRKFTYKYRRQASFLLLALLLGPCLITNMLLKEHWGRARPDQIAEFGGTKYFTPALLPTDQCVENCSFVAGHPSGAFFFFAFALLINEAKKRRKYEALAILFGLLVGLVRLSQGRHFLSDTVFSGLVTISVVWLTHYWIIGRQAFKTAPKVAVPTNL